MGEAKRRRAAGAYPTAPVIKQLIKYMVTIDPQGRLALALCLEIREAAGRVVERKAAGWSDERISEIGNREFHEWHSQGPATIIAQFEAKMGISSR
jgi:hypothetical protein